MEFTPVNLGNIGTLPNASETTTAGELQRAEVRLPLSQRKVRVDRGLVRRQNESGPDDRAKRIRGVRPGDIVLFGGPAVLKTVEEWRKRANHPGNTGLTTSIKLATVAVEAE